MRAARVLPQSARAWLSVLLVLAGLGAVGQAGWIHAKAITAQWLLDRTWARLQAGAVEARPWPWADTAPVAELTVPRLDRRLLVLAGASARTLAFGPAHVTGSAPVGRYGNTILTGHRDTHFAFLRELVPGDVVEMRDREGRLASYRIESSTVVQIDDLELFRDADRRELTMVTCFPFDTVRAGGLLRYVVRAAVPRSSA